MHPCLCQPSQTQTPASPVPQSSTQHAVYRSSSSLLRHDSFLAVLPSEPVSGRVKPQEYRLRTDCTLKFAEQATAPPAAVLLVLCCVCALLPPVSSR
jgi:hypothetical protein